MQDGGYLALVTDAFGGKGGIAQYNRDFLTALVQSESGASIVVLPRSAPEAFALPAGVVQLAPRTGRVQYVLAALWSLQSGPRRTIYCGHIHLAALARLLARLTKSKLIVQMHGIEAWHRPGWLHRCAVEAADLVLCVSRYTRAAVLGWAAIAPERVIVLPNTVAENFTPGDGTALRAELGLAGKRVLLTVGRMDSRERYKGHDRVIAAIPRLIAEGHDVAYVVVGEGDDRGRLETLAAAAGIAERVLFTGPMELSRLVDAYRMADLFVMASTGEGFGIAFIEAMACGTPAIGLDFGGAADALADGELGAVTTVADFYAALSRLLDRPKPDQSTLAAAVRQRFGREAFADNLRAALLPLLHDAA